MKVISLVMFAFIGMAAFANAQITESVECTTKIGMFPNAICTHPFATNQNHTVSCNAVYVATSTPLCSDVTPAVKALVQCHVDSGCIKEDKKFTFFQATIASCTTALNFRRVDKCLHVDCGDLAAALDPALSSNAQRVGISAAAGMLAVRALMR